MIVDELSWVDSDSVGLCVSEMDTFGSGEFAEVYRALIPGRRFACIVKDDLNGKAEKARISSVVAVTEALRAKFIVRHHIIWKNPNEGAQWMAGKAFPHGGGNVLNHNFTDVWVFQKPDTWKSHHARYEDLPPDALPYDLMDRQFFDLYLKDSVWTIHHEAGEYPFAPIRLFETIIRLWSRPAETVLDLYPNQGHSAIAAIAWRRQPVLLARDSIERNDLSAFLERIQMRRLVIT